MLRFKKLVVAAAIALSIFAVQADPRDATIEVPVRTIAAIFGMSLLGGFVSWITKVRSGVINGWSLMQLVGELCTSAFAGTLCFLLCDAGGLSLRMTIFLVGIAGHMGTRAVVAFEKFAEKRWGDLAGTTKDQQ